MRGGHMTDLKYSVWLAGSLPYASEKGAQILSDHNDLEEFYKAGRELYKTLDYLEEKDVKSLSENGRKRNFCRELKSPTPNHPPDPKE